MRSAVTSTSSGPFDPYCPLKNVPNEVWSMIFVHCLIIGPLEDEASPSVLDDWDNWAPGPPYQGPSHPPLVLQLFPIVLASVCRSWRAIICDTPQLWQACQLSVSHPELNTLWLGRAGGLGLGLEARGYSLRWDLIFHSILPFQHRWKSLVLDEAGSDADVPEFDITGLKTLVVRMTSTPSWLLRLIRHSPYITTIDLRKPSSTLLSELGLLRYLRTLRVDGIFLMQLLSTLPLLPQLQHLDAYLSIFPHQRGYILSPIAHKKLITFDFGARYEDMGRMLNSLTTPSLRHIRMRKSFPVHSLLNLLDRSQCQITELSTAECHLPSSILIRMPRLEKLELYGIAQKQNITDELTQFLQDLRNLPHLTEILFLFPDFGEEEINDFISNAIIPRCRPRICGCVDCARGIAKRVHLKYIFIGGLDIDYQALTIAQLVPLPEDRTECPADAGMVMEIVTQADDFNRGYPDMTRFKHMIRKPSGSS